jgi:Na+-transporting methylmalonyl-CoA/oxaloacetate decarboxylase gamma subunit
MAEKTPDDAKTKDAQAKPAGRKLPPVFTKLTFEGILLVFVPFVVFLVVFLYAMGLVPPRAAVIQVPVQDLRVAGSAGGISAQSAAREEGRTAAGTGAVAERPAAPEITPALVDSALTGKLPTAAAQTDSIAPKRAAIDSIAVALVQERGKRMKQIAKVYEQMNASSVAAIVANMPQSDAVEILSKMTPRGAAKVLSVLDPEKAAKFSLELAQ